MARSPIPPSVLELLVADFEAANSTYKVLLEPSGSPTVLGTGGSSVVLLTAFRDTLQRAVKLLFPSEDLLSEQSGTSFLQSFRNEQRLLSDLNHESLALLVDFGEFTSRERNVPFVATQYVVGPELQDLGSLMEIRWSDLLRLLEQILGALAYIHSKRIMHCDIKPANIRIRLDSNTGAFNAVLLDLGVAKSIPVSASELEFTYFFSTKKYTHPTLLPYLANKSGNRIPWSELVRAYPGQDLYGLGKTLSEVLDLWSDSFPHKISDVLRDFAGRLCDGTIASADEALRTVRRLAGDGLTRLASPELVTGLTATRRIRLPGQMIGIDGRVGPFVDHPIMQRLHNVPQLDLLELVFPAASHSRFVHSLRTLELSRTAIEHLSTLPEIALEMSPLLVDGLMFRALLNNAGHYHLLHVFEDFIEDRRLDDRIAALNLLSDEEVFELLVGLRSPSSSAPWIARKDRRGDTFANVIERYLGPEWIKLQSDLRQPSTPIQQTIAGLLSSPVDLEKLAYLRDDAYFTGMSFGAAVDAQSIIGSITCPPSTGQSGPQLNIREGGLAYVEAAVLARYWQIQRGYWHRTNRALQGMAKFVIGSLIVGGAFDFNKYLSETENLSQWEALRYISSRYDRLFKDELKAGQRTNPLDSLLRNERLIYKRVLTLSPKTQSDERAGDEGIYRYLSTWTTLQLMDLTDELRLHLESELKRPIVSGDILIDLPRREREEMGGHVIVWSDDGREILGDLNKISPIVQVLHNSFDLYAKRLRVFLHPRLAEDDVVQIRTAVLDFLRGRFRSGARRSK